MKDDLAVVLDRLADMGGELGEGIAIGARLYRGMEESRVTAAQRILTNPKLTPPEALELLRELLLDEEGSR